MTNTDDGETSPNTQGSPHRSKSDVLLDVLRLTWVPLAIFLVAIGVIAGLWWYGLPERPLSIAILTACIAGPFIAVYAYLFAVIYQRRIDVPVVLNDPDGQVWGLKYLHPDEFGSSEIEGDQLATRTARSTGETVYFAEGHRIEARERIDENNGEKVTVPVRVLESTWEGEIPTQEFVEYRLALKEQRERLVPMAYQGLKARAGADIQAVENTDQLGHALLLGAEDDNFLAAGTNPFDFDVERATDKSLDGLVPRRGERDDQEEREKDLREAARRNGDDLDDDPLGDDDVRTNGHPADYQDRHGAE